jgi:hypothetical protein
MRRRRALAVVALVLAGIGVAVYLPRGLLLLNIGAGYAAKQVCACVFISGRKHESCEKDLSPLARHMVWTEVGEQQVTASALGIARATSRHEDGYGCTLVP